MTRVGQQRQGIIKREMNNAFAKHLHLDHPEQAGNPDVFNIKVEKVYKKCLDRQVMEGVKISAMDPDQRLNSKAEYLQPSVVRIGATRELPETVTERRGDRRTNGL